MLGERKDDLKTLFFRNPGSLRQVDEKEVLEGSGKEASRMTKFKLNISRAEWFRLKKDNTSRPFFHSWKKSHTHFDFITVDRMISKGSFECRVK